MKDFFQDKKQNFAHLPPGYRQAKHEPLDRGQSKSGRIKKYLKFSVIALTFSGTLCLLFLHPFFQVTSISIQGLHKIKESELRDTISGILSYKKFYLLPQNNFFLVDIDEMHTILTQKYAVQNLMITKQFPHTLSISLEEKLSTIIYDNGAQYSLVDANGKISEILRIVDDNEWRVIRKTVTSTNESGVSVNTDMIVSRVHTPNYKNLVKEIGEYPLIYDTRQKTIGKGEQILDETTVKQVIDWYELLKKTDVPVSYFQIDQEVGDVTIRTAEGWYIKAKLNDKISEQFQVLEFLLKEKVERAKIQYIDVRFPGRAFWVGGED